MYVRYIYMDIYLNIDIIYIYILYEYYIIINITYRYIIYVGENIYVWIYI